jgi:regulator of PEP synthase PpsR (kinase-PPPase family)
MKKIEKKKRRSTMKKVIYLVSESTGETIVKIERASLSQFTLETVEVKKFFLVKDKQYIKRILKQAVEDDLERFLNPRGPTKRVKSH